MKSFKEICPFPQVVEFMCTILPRVFPYYTFNVCRVYSDASSLIHDIGHFVFPVVFINQECKKNTLPPHF